MYHRQTSTHLLNRRKSGVAEVAPDSSLSTNDTTSDRKFATVSAVETSSISRNRLSKVFAEDNSSSDTKYALPRKSSLRASRNFSANPQRMSTSGPLQMSSPAKNESEGRVSSEITDYDRGNESSFVRNKEASISKVYDTDVSDNKELKITRKSSTGRLRPKSRALKSPPPPLNFDGPPTMPSLSSKYALYSPRSAHTVTVSERSSSLHPENGQPNQELLTTNKIKRHQSLGANAQNRPPRSSSHRNLQQSMEGGSTLTDNEKLMEKTQNISRKSLPASFRSRSRVTAEKPIEILVSELDVTSNPERSSSLKKENRKSGSSLRRSSSRVSISEYQGYTRSSSTHTHRRSISSSPPPSRSSSAFGDVDEAKGNILDMEKEDIPPVPPVPKHHSFFNKGIESLKLSHSRNNSLSPSKDTTSDDGSDYQPRQHHQPYMDGIGDNQHANRLSHRGSTSVRRKPSIATENHANAAHTESLNLGTENAHFNATTIVRSPVDRYKYLDAEAQEARNITAQSTELEKKSLGKTIISRRRGKVSRIRSCSVGNQGLANFVLIHACMHRSLQTLPGNLAAPPPVPSLPLPPMKLEPMKFDIRGSSSRRELPRSPSNVATATTPTRIPVPVFRYGLSKGANSDMDLNATGGQTTSSEDESNPLGYKLPVKNGRQLNKRRLSYSKGSRTAPSSPRIPQFTISSTKSASQTNLQDVGDQDDDDNAPLSTKSPASVFTSGKSSATSDYDKMLTSASSQTTDMTSRRISRSGANTIGSQAGKGYANRRHSVASVSSLDTHAPDVAKKPTYTLATDESILRRRHERNRRLSLHERLQNLVAEHRIKEDDEELDAKWDPKLALEVNKIDTREQHASQRTPKRASVRPHTVYEEYDIRKFSTSDDKESAQPNLFGSEGMKPRHALEAFSSQLCPYEREEIPKYSKVYYISPKDRKHYATPEKPEFNHGYDDERGDYNITMHDHLCYRYEITETLGKGSFGQVLKCLDHKTGEYVAIKIIRNKKRFHAQALVEVKILQDLVSWVSVYLDSSCN
jgi:hypothetical protein